MQQEEKQHINTSDDLAKDMEFKGDEYKNMEGESRSTAAEGELKTTDENQQNTDDTASGPITNPAKTSEEKTDTQTTNDDPTHIPTLKEDESMDKEQG